MFGILPVCCKFTMAARRMISLSGPFPQVLSSGATLLRLVESHSTRFILFKLFGLKLVYRFGHSEVPTSVRLRRTEARVSCHAVIHTLVYF